MHSGLGLGELRRRRHRVRGSASGSRRLPPHVAQQLGRLHGCKRSLGLRKYRRARIPVPRNVLAAGKEVALVQSPLEPAEALEPGDRRRAIRAAPERRGNSPERAARHAIDERSTESRLWPGIDRGCVAAPLRRAAERTPCRLPLHRGRLAVEPCRQGCDSQRPAAARYDARYQARQHARSGSCRLRSPDAGRNQPLANTRRSSPLRQRTPLSRPAKQPNHRDQIRNLRRLLNSGTVVPRPAPTRTKERSAARAARRARAGARAEPLVARRRAGRGTRPPLASPGRVASRACACRRP